MRLALRQIRKTKWEEEGREKRGRRNGKKREANIKIGYYNTMSCLEVGSDGSGDSKSMCVMLAEYEVGGKRIRLWDPSPLYVRGSDQQLDAAAQGDSRHRMRLGARQNSKRAPLKAPYTRMAFGG